MSGFFTVNEEMVAAAEATAAEEAKAFSIPSGFYPVKINVAYLTESETSEAAGLTIEYTTAEWKYPKRETLWFQGRDGGTTRMAKKRDGSEYPDETFGMKQVRGLCKAVDVEFEKIETSDGVIEVKDGNKNVKVFGDFTGKTLVVGLQETLEDKYSDPTEETTKSSIIWVGKSDTDTEGVQFPWGRTQSYDKFQKAIDKEPVKDDRELSKPGTVSETGADDAAAAFGGGFGS